MNEAWRSIPGHPHYEVSDVGRVRSCGKAIIRSNGARQTFRARILKDRPTRTGYMIVTLTHMGVVTHHTVHALVMLAFVGVRPEGLEIAHWDGNKANNHLSNLRYATRKENAADTDRLGRRNRGEAVAGAKLTAKIVSAIRAGYIRSGYGKSNTKELAARYGVTPSLIIQVLAKRVWGHI